MQSAAVRERKPFIDALEYLPISRIVHYRKGQHIYHFNQPLKSIYLIMNGQVKVCRKPDERHQIIVGLYRADEFIGEAAMVGASQNIESAVALERTELMTWTREQIVEIVARNPKLALAFVQLIVERSIELKNRIESFTLDSIPIRLLRTLIRFSGRYGTEMPPFTHEVLGEYIGTSREVVTVQMGHFQRAGLLEYSRVSILLNRAASREWLDAQQIERLALSLKAA